MAEETFLARLVVIGRDEKRAIDPDFLRFSGVGDRVAGRVRAGAGDDLATAARFSTASSMTWWRSPQLRVGDSPVVPTGTIPVIPAAICVSIRLRERVGSRFRRS